MEIESSTAAAWPKIIDALTEEPVTGSRIGGTKERMCVTVRSENPRERWLLRDDSFNLAFGLQESFAYWMGLNPGHVERYNSNMQEWMVDGELPGSAYGDRLRNTAGHDQIERAIDQIRSNPESRRAVMQVHQSNVEDYDGGDVSCTAHLQVFARDGELHMHAVIRSQDMYWGYPYDTQNNQAIQEWMAGRLGLELGEYWHTMASCHYYTDFESEVLNAYHEHEVASGPELRLAPDTHDEAMGLLDRGLGFARDGDVPTGDIEALGGISNAYGDWLRVMTAYEQARFHDDLDAAVGLAKNVDVCAWRGWLDSYLARKIAADATPVSDQS